MRILVVNDQRRLAGALERDLQTEGFVVDVALDGAQGLRMARKQTCDTMVLGNLLWRDTVLRSAGEARGVLAARRRGPGGPRAAGLLRPERGRCRLRWGRWNRSLAIGASSPSMWGTAPPANARWAPTGTSSTLSGTTPATASATG
ncbi:MAG: hypothetical protein ACRDZQ_07085 [Acidimicrobiales bacterium]